MHGYYISGLAVYMCRVVWAGGFLRWKSPVESPQNMDCLKEENFNVIVILDSLFLTF